MAPSVFFPGSVQVWRITGDAAHAPSEFVAAARDCARTAAIDLSWRPFPFGHGAPEASWRGWKAEDCGPNTHPLNPPPVTTAQPPRSPAFGDEAFFGP